MSYDFLVVQTGKEVKLKSPILAPLAMISIYSMFFPVILLDLFLWQYQLIYFGLMRIPKIKRSDYVVMDRRMLKNLTFMQKLNCVYCEYVNGCMAYAKDVAAQTEIHSCAIKHNKVAAGQTHQKDFFEYNDFK